MGVTGSGAVKPSAFELQRLALPRFLFREGERALERSGAYAHALATSILQDTVEAFLRVLVDLRHINVGPNANFDTLLGVVAVAYPSVGGYRATLSSLNKARVAFKHHGLRVPSSGDAAAFAVNVRDFLATVTREAFGIDFASVSLADAIGHRRTQNWLREAEVALDEGEHDEAMRKVAGAFSIYLAHRRRQDLSLGWLGHTGARLPSFPSSTLEQENRYLAQFTNVLGERIATLEERLDLVTRGVDMAAYDRFRVLTPKVMFTVAGTAHFTTDHAFSASARGRARLHRLCH